MVATQENECLESSLGGGLDLIHPWRSVGVVMLLRKLCLHGDGTRVIAVVVPLREYYR